MGRLVTPAALLPCEHNVHLWRRHPGLRLQLQVFAAPPDTPLVTPPTTPPALRASTEANLNAGLPPGLSTRASDVPAHIAEHPAFQARRRAFESRCEQGQAFNGAVWVGHDITETPGGAVLRCAPAWYGDVISASQCYESGLLRTNWEANTNWPFASVGVNTSVITHEGLVLVGQRSPTMGKWPGAWFVEFGEGIGPGDEGDMQACALRCLQEELGVARAALERVSASVQIWAFGVEHGYLGWVALAVADFRGAGELFSARALLSRHHKAHDSWEASNLQALPLSELTAFLAEKPLVASTGLSLSLLHEALSRSPHAWLQA